MHTFDNEALEAVKQRLEEKIPTYLAELALHPVLEEATHYALSGGGKRIRPLLLIALAKALRRDDTLPSDLLYRSAFSLELLHTASLIHDDMPELDNDDYRRGKESCHKKFGGGAALLLGDILIPSTTMIITHSNDGDNSTKLTVVSSLHHAYLDLCNGQAYDAKITDQGDKKDQIALKEIFRLKTGALFRSAGEIAAAVSMLSDDTQKTLGSHCEALGVLFQVLNDYYDIYGSAEERGRPVSSDKSDLTRNIFGTRNKEETIAECTVAIEQELKELQRFIGTHTKNKEGEEILNYLLNIFLARAQALRTL